MFQMTTRGSRPLERVTETCQWQRYSGQMLHSDRYPQHLSRINDVKVFKSKLKTHYFSTAYNQVIFIYQIKFIFTPHISKNRIRGVYNKKQINKKQINSNTLH